MKTYNCDACKKEIKSEDISEISLLVYGEGVDHLRKFNSNWDLCIECSQEVKNYIVKELATK